jgi:radical SAM protein with 4Fe4S-binding SPASM domain
MALEDWKDILQQAADLGCRRVQFIGGEVLLYRHLLQLVDRAEALGYTFIEIYTNGTLLTERRVKALAQRNVQLAVSLHGSEGEAHDAITGQPGSYERTVAGLGRLPAADIPFRIAGTALRQNQHSILGLPELGRQLGAREVSFDVVRSVGSGSNSELHPDDARVLAEKWLTWPDFVADRVAYEHNRRWNPCWAGKLAVSSTGDVMPCVMGRSEVVGNVHEETLGEILAIPRLHYLWGLTKDHVAVCQDCEYRYVCGDCRPLAAGAGDLHGVIPRCTYHPQTGDWGRPGTDERRPGPAIEGARPQIVLASEIKVNFAKREADRSFLFRRDPDWISDEPDDSRQVRPRQRLSTSTIFKCDPDR